MRRLLSIGIVAALAGTAGAEPRIDPYAAVALEELYDSNVLNTRGADEVTRVTPELGLRRLDHRLELGLDYRVGIHTYAEGTADTSINHRAGAWMRYQLNRRALVQATGSLVVADDPVVLERPAVAVPLGGVVESEVGTRLKALISRRLTGEGGVAWRRSRFDLAEGPMPVAFDGDELDADARASYRLTRRFDLTFALLAQHFINYGPPDDTAISPSAGFAYRLTRRLRTSLEGGPAAYIEQGGLTWVGRGQLVWAGQRLRADLRGAREIYGGTGAAEAIWIESARAGLSYKLGSITSVRAVGGMSRQGIAMNQPVDTSTLTGRAELRFALFGRSTSLDFYAEHRAQDASGGLAFSDIQRTLVGLRFTAVMGADIDDLQEVP